jgi:hypothetical protein
MLADSMKEEKREKNMEEKKKPKRVHGHEFYEEIGSMSGRRQRTPSEIEK